MVIILKMRIFLLLLLLLSDIWKLGAQVRGRVVDQQSSPLISCHILVFPDSLQFLSDADGNFSITNITPGLKTLYFSYLGYSDQQVEISFSGKTINIGSIVMKQDQVVLRQITILDEHAKQEQSLSHIHIQEEFFHTNLQGSFAATLEKVPGISAINVGVGIAKPVIRGLSGNRIIVNHYGIKQESQQWGLDHGLELDVFDVERIEIVKGPATIQYGSDGLGGVLNVQSGAIVPQNTFRSNIVGVFKSNNQHFGGSYGFAFRKKEFFMSGRYSIQNYADFAVPANQFEYNGFVLPIVNNRLKNTAGMEENRSVVAGVIKKNSITRLIFNHYKLDSGIFSGAVGIPRSYALTDDGNRRNIATPSQSVDHYRFTVNQSFVMGKDHLLINAGYQLNKRREFTFPEFHNIPRSVADINDNLGLSLDLVTISANVHYERSHEFGKIVLGADIQSQNNVRGGFEFLLPDFTTLRSGIFSILEYERNENTIVIAGLRFDIAHNRSVAERQYIWDANERIIDSLVVPMTNDLFYNWSAAVGFNRRLSTKRVLRANFSKSFRVPYPSETVSNGIHHGTFRHEIGQADLKSENGFQFDIGIESESKKFNYSFAAYFNYFQNYIYLGPVFPAQFSPLPESGQIFKYQQDNAIHTGFELQWSYAFTGNTAINSSFDFVQTYNTRTGLSLPFTPQASIKTDIAQSLWVNKLIKRTELVLEHAYYFSAEGPSRKDRTEKATPSTHLFHVAFSADIKMGSNLVKFNLRVHNIFDTAFLNHLSRYRWINVPEQGRNVVVSFKIPMNFSI